MHKVDNSTVLVLFFFPNYYICSMATQDVIMGRVGVKDTQEFFIVFLQLLKSIIFSKWKVRNKQKSEVEKDACC